MVSKRGQVWVETVIYTLIGLTVMGLLLAVANSKISEMKDKAKIEQSIEAMSTINDKIYEVLRAPGNQRVVDLKITEGKLVFDLENDKISWVLESNYEYSEPGVVVSLGDMTVLTEEASPWRVTLEREYSFDLRYDGETIGVKEISSASTLYEIYIKNDGLDGGNTVVEINAI